LDQPKKSKEAFSLEFPDLFGANNINVFIIFKHFGDPSGIHKIMF